MKEYEYKTEKLTTICEAHDRINTIINDVDILCNSFWKYDDMHEFANDILMQIGNAFELLEIAKEMSRSMENAIAYRNEVLGKVGLVKCPECGWRDVDLGSSIPCLPHCSGCGKTARKEAIPGHISRWVIDGQ